MSAGIPLVRIEALTPRHPDAESFYSGLFAGHDITADCSRMRYTFVCVAAPLRVPLHKRSENAVPHSFAIRCNHQDIYFLVTQVASYQLWRW